VWRDVTVWADGKVVHPDEARVSVFDRGLTVGDAVFETVKVVAGEPFALTRHLDRLAASAAGLGLPAPQLDAVREAIAEVLAAGPAPRPARLRVTYTGGHGGLRRAVSRPLQPLMPLEVPGERGQLVTPAPAAARRAR
jgi:branched-chain amino acid aminotransferase